MEDSNPGRACSKEATNCTVHQGLTRNPNKENVALSWTHFGLCHPKGLNKEVRMILYINVFMSYKD